jgi:hypothetical protein
MTSVYPAFTVLFSPVKAFQSLSEESRTGWVPAFILCGLLSILIAYGLDPIMQAVITNNLPPGSEAAGQTAIAPSANPITAPLGVLGRWLVHAGFLWLCIQLVSVPVRFSKVLTVVAYAFISVSIGEALSIALIHYQGVAQITNPLALYGEFGLNQILPGDYSLAVESLLRSVSIFSIWHLGLLTVGLTVFGKMKPGKAFLVSFVTWIFPVLLGAATFSLFHQVRSLTM